MERLIIHLGLHKTGTTAVQEFLQANRAKLLQRGTDYIPLDRMHNNLTAQLFYDRADGARQAAERLFETIRTPALILSDENITGGIADVPEGHFYPTAGDRLKSIFDVLRNVDVQLVLTLREPAELVPALYSEYLRFNDFIDFNTYVANFDLSSISYWETFAWLRSLPGNVSVHLLPFEAQLGGSVARVAAVILKAAIGRSVGFDLYAPFQKKVRTSFSGEEIELASTIASKCGGKVAHLFLKDIDTVGARFGERRHSPLRPALAAALSERYRGDLARFGRHFDGQSEEKAKR